MQVERHDAPANAVTKKMPCHVSSSGYHCAPRRPRSDLLRDPACDGLLARAAGDCPRGGLNHSSCREGRVCWFVWVISPPVSSTFLSEQTSHRQPTSSTPLSERTSTGHQPPAERAARAALFGSLTTGDPLSVHFRPSQHDATFLFFLSASNKAS
jgi:hypothetical protein